MADLRYPNEFIYESTDWFRIGIAAYTPGSLVGSGTSTNTFPTETNYIILPMPSNIQDGNSVAYDENGLNPIAAAGLNGATALMDITLDSNFLKTGGAALNKVKEEFNNIGAGNVLDLLKKSLAAEAISVFGGNITINSLLARESGQILNPNMELLFSGVTLRTFRFSFKMTPRDNDESKNIRKIIYTLKQNMAPKNGSTFVSTPNVFNLEYKKGNQSHPFLHKFKPCFLKDMAVNYTGENTYVTYSDGTPISITMDLTFQEMFPIYDNDYGSFDDSSATQGVGF